MPIYEFHCEKCDCDSEILVRSSKWKGAKCPHCGSTKLEKKLSVFASSRAAADAADACSLSPTGKRGGCGCCCGGGGRHRH